MHTICRKQLKATREASATKDADLKRKKESFAKRDAELEYYKKKVLECGGSLEVVKRQNTACLEREAGMREQAVLKDQQITSLRMKLWELRGGADVHERDQLRTKNNGLLKELADQEKEVQ